MTRDEEQQDLGQSATVCADCGVTFYGETDRGFEIGGELGALCQACAVRRGGSYDADRDVWTVAPSAEDLRRPWSPRD